MGAPMKLFEKKRVSEIELLIKEINQTKVAMESANSNFDYAVDPDLIDCYIFEVNSVHKRYKHLLDKAKELENSFTAAKI
jgi:carbamoylphosphate synthase large subunit